MSACFVVMRTNLTYAELGCLVPSSGGGEEAVPPVWMSGSFGAQRGRSEVWHMCLAFLLRDTQSAIGCGGDRSSPAFERLLLHTLAIGRRRSALRDTMPAQCQADPE